MSKAGSGSAQSQEAQSDHPTAGFTQTLTSTSASLLHHTPAILTQCPRSLKGDGWDAGMGFPAPGKGIGSVADGCVGI